MRHIFLLLSVLSLVGCGSGNSDTEKPKLPEAVKPVVAEPVKIKPVVVKPIEVKPTEVKPVDPKDIALAFFHVDMYQNGAADIKYIETSAKNQKYDINLNVLNQRSKYEDKISHKLNYTDANGDVYSESYVVDIESKLIIKVDESVLYKDTTYKTFNYNGKYVQFDFNLEKGQENSKQFNVDTFDSALHQFVVVPTKVTTKYLGLDKIEVGNTLYNAGEFETIEETDHSIVETTTWFDTNNGVILKQAKNINNLNNNTAVENVINIVDSSVDFDVNYNESAFSKFKLDLMDSEAVSENINLYKGVNDPVVVNLVNNNIKVSGYDHSNPQFIPDNVVSTIIESHSGGVLSSFISKIQYGRVCEFNCSGAMINTFHMLGVRSNFDSSKNYDSEYAGKYYWYEVKDNLRPSDHFIVMDLKAKTCQVSSTVKLNRFLCENLLINTNTGEIAASIIEDPEIGSKRRYGSLFAIINGENNEFITGVVRTKGINSSGVNNDSIDTFIIKKRN